MPLAEMIQPLEKMEVLAEKLSRSSAPGVANARVRRDTAHGSQTLSNSDFLEPQGLPTQNRAPATNLRWVAAELRPTAP